MIVSVEISYYPLAKDYQNAVKEFLKHLAVFDDSEEVSVTVGSMSTLLVGDYSQIMELLKNSMASLMQKHASVFHLKVSNSCSV